MGDSLAQSSDILTSRLLITSFGERHITQTYLGWLNDPEIMFYSEQRHIRHTPESSRLYLKSFEGTSNYFWAIEEVETGLGHIGNINAYVDHNNLLADVGVLIGEPKAQRKYYGLEAWLGVCNFLFQEIGIRKVTAGALSVNVPMLKLMKRAGMVDNGIRKRQYLCDGREVHILHKALFREQWGRFMSDSESVAKKYLKMEE
ncbi:MAG: GNAT family N-acetyltransferase [Desulfobacteraceae bacterium]|nr:GNAT family N-acetyltransferase [Desulfobacteraceae bacterium]